MNCGSFLRNITAIGSTDSTSPIPPRNSNLNMPMGGTLKALIANPNDNPIVKGAANAVDSIKFIDEESGDTEERAGFPADRFPDPFPNEFAARASNGGALPPDLSIIVKAREGGANYIYSILTGYAPPATALKVTENMYYNNAMPGDLSGAWTGDEHAMPEGGFIAMKPPLTANKVTYADGTVASVNQMAKDVVTFLAWASEPKQTERKRYGMWVLAFLIGMTLLAYGSYRRVWKNESH